MDIDIEGEFNLYIQISFSMLAMEYDYNQYICPFMI